MASSSRMTKYECAHLLGLRHNQLNQSSPILCATVPDHLQTNFLYIALRELIEGKLDVWLIRPLPGREHARVHIRDLTLPCDVYEMERTLRGSN